jgi:hypothetical protein
MVFAAAGRGSRIGGLFPATRNADAWQRAGKPSNPNWRNKKMTMGDHESVPIGVLIDTFPRLFRGKQPRVWSDLPMGWVDLVSGALRDVDAVLAGSPDHGRFEIKQIKEKFGRLCIYSKLAREGGQVLSAHEETPSRFGATPWQPSALFMAIRQRVDEAELASASVCQRCGISPATALATGWLVTLCDACRTKAEMPP